MTDITEDMIFNIRFMIIQILKIILFNKATNAIIALILDIDKKQHSLI